MKEIKYDEIILYYYKSFVDKNGISRLASKHSGSFTLRQFLLCGKGDLNFINIIKELRNKEYHSAEYNKLKESLPLFWLCGKSNSGYRRKSDITIKYNIFSIDIDKKDNAKLFEDNDIEILKDDLFNQIPSCFCAMKSAGGLGIVLYLLLDDNLSVRNEKQYFNYFCELFNNAGINIDTQTNDILTRARYISYDENILMRNEVEPFKLPDTYIKKYIKDKKENKKELKEYEIKNIDDIQYLNSIRRYKYCYTLKKLFGKKQAERITKEIYDLKYNGTSDRNEAYNHIEASCRNDTEYIDEGIYKELQILGIVEKEEVIEEHNDIIELKDNEYMYDKKDIILNKLVPGINMEIAPTGTGKTEFWNMLREYDKYKICVVEPFTSVVDGKYDKEKTNIAAGIGNRIDNEAEYTATNYLKFIWGVKNNIQKYDYLVIDESHLIGMQDYRAENLIEFINAVNIYMEKYPDSKIILQTASPSNEDFFFNIKNTITIKKDVKKFVQIHYTHSLVYKGTVEEGDKLIEDYKEDIIKTIMFYTRMYRNEGRKVYIYWGSGGITDMKIYQKAEKLINFDNTAIYHTRNKGNEDMEYITNEKKMGKYDILMTSCYFSVGCDLNDECNAAIIIIGNNPYQEDEQVIGRFRKSRNIKVNIILNDNKVPYVDVSKILEAKEQCARLINDAKDLRTNSLIKKYTRNDAISLKAYIECSKYYFSDLERKFEYYKTKNYNLVNEINIELENGKRLYYNIYERTKDGVMPMLYLIDYKEESIKQIIKDRKNLINTIKENIYKELLNDETFELGEIIEEAKDKPALQDWLLALQMIKNYYNIKTFLQNIKKEYVFRITKTKLNDLIHLKIKKDKNEVDNVEVMIIEKLCDVYDNISDKEMIEIYIALYYCLWCKFYEEQNNYTYDMVKVQLAYPVYKEWSKRIFNIINVNKEVRDYFLNYDTKTYLNEDSASYLFLKDIIEEQQFNEIKKDYEIFVNKYIHKTCYKQFIEYIIKLKFGKKEEIKKESGKTGGKIGGKKGKQITIDGKVYETIKDAAKQLGISRQGLYKRLKG